MKFKIIILVSFSTLFHSESNSPFCVCFSVRSGKHYGFSLAYENINIIKNDHFLNKLEGSKLPDLGKNTCNFISIILALMFQFHTSNCSRVQNVVAWIIQNY